MTFAEWIAAQPDRVWQVVTIAGLVGAAAGCAAAAWILIREALDERQAQIAATAARLERLRAEVAHAYASRRAVEAFDAAAFDRDFTRRTRGQALRGALDLRQLDELTPHDHALVRQTVERIRRDGFAAAIADLEATRGDDDDRVH